MINAKIEDFFCRQVFVRRRFCYVYLLAQYIFHCESEIKNYLYCHCSRIWGYLELLIEEPGRNCMYLTRKMQLGFIRNAHIF